MTKKSPPSRTAAQRSPAGTMMSPVDRVRLEHEFERPHLMGPLFGQYDENLIVIERELGVHISARGNKVLIEGEADSVARARDVLTGLYNRLAAGRPLDPGDIAGAVAISGDPSLDGLVRADSGSATLAAIHTRRKIIVARSPTQVRYIEALSSHDVIFALGPAGTGKTYLAVAQAVSQLVAGSVDRLVLSRPAVEAGERLGFLPGDMKDKVDPYLRPLYDALYDMLPAEQVERRLSSGEIEVAPLAFMRGRTLANAFIILDEAQNTTPLQMKMFLTRFGQGSRMVVCGDPNQVDLPNPSMSGLADAVRKLDGIDGIATLRFSSSEVVRHPIVGKIVEAYEGPPQDG